MNALKNILIHLKPVLGGLYPLVLLALALAVPLGVLASKWLKSRAEKRKQQAAQAPDATPPPLVRPRTDRLWTVWKRFLAQLSPTYRRSILRFQPFLVMGAAASGKSRLIDTCSDWRRMERQLAGSRIDDANLQIYLDSQALLFELPQVVLHDTSSNGREALLHLCKPLFRHRKPLVVVTLDAVVLASLPTDTVRDQADRLRGKLNLLAEVCRSPLEVRVVLTHLDQVRGYAQFARFLASYKASATLALEPEELDSELALERALRQRFVSFEKLLPLALTQLPGEDHLEVVAFLSEGPAYLPPVGHFLTALCAHNPRAPRPVVERVYLAAGPEHGGGANPFHSSRDTSPQRAPSPLWRHRVAAMACAALGILYLTAGYLYEQRLWKPAVQAVAGDNDDLPAERFLQDINRFSNRHLSGPMRFFPSFFSFQDKELEQRLSRKVRDHLEKLLVALRTAPANEQPHLRGLYLLAVLYATQDNALGLFVLEDPKHWAGATELSQKLLETYVDSATQPYTGQPDLTHLRPPRTRDATNDARPWVDFSQQLGHAFTQGMLKPQEMADFQTQASTLFDALEVIQRYSKSQRILDLLEDEATSLELKRNMDVNALPPVKAAERLGTNLSEVKLLLTKVKQGAPSEKESEIRLLSELNEQLRQLLDAQSQKSARSPEEGTHPITANQWEDLIRDSTLSDRVRHFMNRPAEFDASIFFSGEETLAPLRMNALGEGGALFPGKATVDGRYTRVAFDRYVRAPLVTFCELADKLQALGKLDQVERIQLERVIEREVRSYARTYARSMDSYYRSFRVEVKSVTELQFLLERMQSENSAFTELLSVVSENTALALDDDKAAAEQTPSRTASLMFLLNPLREELAHYTALHRIMDEKTPGELQLATYRTQLKLMSLALTGQGASGKPAPAAQGKDDKEKQEEEVTDAALQKGLRERLSPVGLLALDMLLLDKNAYDALIQKWLDDVGLDPRHMKPFLAPVDELRTLGRQEIEQTVDTQWRNHILPELVTVLSAFPFDREARRDVTPEELQILFHPQTGRFHKLTHQLVEPFSERPKRLWRKRRMPGGLNVPAELYPMLNKAQQLTDLLWDVKGNPQPLRLQVLSVPFEAEPASTSALRARALLTLAYLHSGTSSVVNFNQRPASTVVELDWTRPRQARLGIETVDRASGIKTHPTPLQSDMSCWGMLHLLNKGTQQDDVWTWSFTLPLRQQDKGQRPTIPVSFKFQSDPWALFEFLPSMPSEASASSSEP